ncbi:MAG: transglutaminase domain-containing protein [Ardenticatenaceae bacterium]|nr:transglutaminase domain-containing protein [Ardenticatenaceae bacterium]
MADFYRSQSTTSNPGKYAYLFDGLPPDLAGIAKVAQGLVYHYFAHQHIYGWAPPQERLSEINTRTMPRILETLLAKDGRPLTKSRDYENRLVGCCRDFSLLACAILRHQGRAARVRHGFASYFVPDYWVDHVIVELWDDGRWRRFDPQLSSQQDWGFDTLDMPANAFVTGGRAWQMCRFENEDPNRFGLGPDETQVRGWWFIRERLQQDVAALNKVELLCWDGWDGLVEGRPEDEAVLDEMAALSLNPDSRELRERCQSDERWQIPATVRCFHPAVGSSMVTVA